MMHANLSFHATLLAGDSKDDATVWLWSGSCQ